MSAATVKRSTEAEIESDVRGREENNDNKKSATSTMLPSRTSGAEHEVRSPTVTPVYSPAIAAGGRNTTGADVGVHVNDTVRARADNGTGARVERRRTITIL